MVNYKYTVEILKEGRTIKGRLQEVKKVNKMIEYEFAPTSIFFDLSIFKNSDNIIDKDIIYTGYEYEKAFGKPIKISKREDKYYYALTQFIRGIIINNEKISIKELDQLRLIFDIKMNYSISYKEKNSLYNKLKGIKEIQEFTYKTLEYNSYNLEHLSENNKGKSHIYFYNCFNLTDVVFSILHYLTINKYYKIRKCNHCEKLYLYNHSNNKYCNRNSPIKKYDHLECEQAVRNIIQLCNRRNKVRDEKIEMEYYHNLKKYRSYWKKYKEIATTEPTVENLIRLAKLTSIKYAKEHFYIDED